MSRNAYLFVLYHMGVIVRYLVLLPARVMILLSAFVLCAILMVRPAQTRACRGVPVRAWR